MTDVSTRPEATGTKDVGKLASAAELVERNAWLDFFDAAPTTVRETLGLSSIRISGMGMLASAAIPITELNRAMAVGIDGQPSAEEFDGAVEWLDKHAAPSWALQIAPIANTAARDCVDRHGLRASGAGWAKFVTALPAADVWVPSTAARASVADAHTARSFGTTVQSGFGLPEGSARWFEALVGRPGWLCFISTLDGEPAGAAAMFASDNAAWSGMSATLPAYRERGVQSSLIAARLNAANDRGVMVLTSETGRPSADNETGARSYRNQKRGGLVEVYTRLNFKRSS